MKNVNAEQLSKLNKYFKTFDIKYSDVSKELGLDTSMLGKYFNNKANMSCSRYNEILTVLKDMANEDELKTYLIDNWLKIKTEEEKKNNLKSLVNQLGVISLEMKDILGE